MALVPFLFTRMLRKTITWISRSRFLDVLQDLKENIRQHAIPIHVPEATHVHTLPPRRRHCHLPPIHYSNYLLKRYYCRRHPFPHNTYQLLLSALNRASQNEFLLSFLRSEVISSLTTLNLNSVHLITDLRCHHSNSTSH